MNEQADQPATPGNDAGLPGKTLQSQREAMGWSVEQVADQLKLAPRQVVALEAGDYASLPSPAVTRGFVRIYAKLLKIDPAPLVAKIEMNMPAEALAGATASVPRREQRPTSFSQSRFPIGGKRSKLPVGLIAGALVLVAAGAALWHFGLIPGSRPQEADTGTVLETPVLAPAAPNGAAPAAQDPLLNPSVPLISVPAPASEGSAAPATTPPAAAPGSAPATTTPAAPATPAATLAAPVTAVPAAPAAAPAAAGANALVLNVREDAWIGVRPAGGGKPLIWREVKAGSTETVDVAGPVTLTVGNPGGVTATLRGSAVSLEQAPGKKFAQVSLK
ncbi:helix-turn-helix domain-containing protein [Massilia sp. LjRoot122]|uniref:helix-turn-helix domain-containing protein n=1 Tax=Massilia sp. LjRoot122 TaxID=3342257 RepID=UPI003ECED3C8